MTLIGRTPVDPISLLNSLVIFVSFHPRTNTILTDSAVSTEPRILGFTMLGPCQDAPSDSRARPTLSTLAD